MRLLRTRQGRHRPVMRIASVKIGAITVAVRWETSPRIEDEGRWGEFDYRGPSIAISTVDRSDGAMAETFVHEVLHGLCADAGIRAVMSWDREDEERVVTVLAPRLASFLRDNPDQVRELLRMFK